ncbi:MAG: DNA-directed RNA polymerase subunit beta [bacterium]|nr:DNA-directed RNA polymerase subunit beta [Mycoplasmatota bacterium]MDD6757446.1 DNA-directed RNA polymerase subunit beta [bacterium]MDY2908637.1 DNA-directed RNA polymerase subunit beta [Candidatus Faecimonas sp.]
MAYKNVKYGDYRERRNFSRIRNTYELKDLLEIQKKSYERFINIGIKEVFEDLFPVENFSGTLSLEFGDYHFDEPRYSIKESKDRETTYSAPLRVEVRLLNRETGEVKEQEIFMGDMPMMTESGTFVINGAERVIVSQLVRSPSVYFNREVDKNGRELITSQIIPTRGTWLEFEVDARDVLYVRIDRTRKVTLTTLLRAFGLSSDDQILSMFGEDDYLKNTIAKDSTKNTDEALIEIYEKLRPGEPATLDSSKNQIITRFFDEFRYDLAKVGRYKFNRKLNVIDRLLNQTLAEDVCDADGVVVLEKGTQITKANLDVLKDALNAGFGLQEVTVNDELDTYNKVQVIKIVDPTDKKKKLIVIGNDQSIDVKRLTISDVYASVSYYLNLLHSVGNYDEIDHLGNRRIRQVGELLQNQFRIGVSRMERVIRERMTTQEMEEVTPKTLINIRPVTAAMKEFFGSSQLSQFMDQTNPIAELTNKRRLSALGPGGLSRDRAGVEVRDVNASHYGRICPIESPEGPNIGLITSLASYAKIDEYGFIMTPYRKVVDKKITDEVVYLTADEELDYIISQSTVGTNEDNVIIDDMVNARFRGDNILAKPEQVDYIDVSPQQVVSVTTSCIPFLEHDDATRALMGANMQRQAMPLIKTEAPFVGTGVEFIAAKDSGVEIVCKADGVVEYVDARKIVVKTKNGKDTYRLANFELANSSICSHQRPIVHVGDKVKAGVTILADGNSTDKGELALGKNMTIAFMTFNGYNYEDAVILNENLVKDDKLTSLHLEDYEMQCRETKLGPEEITRDIPNVSEEARRNLDENGIITIGTEVKEGDILVGKVTPKGMAELTSEEKLLHAIFGEKTREVRDTSLRVPHGGDGVVHDIKIYSRKDNDELPAGVSKVIRVYIIQKRKIQVGDKMSGRHGNKGVISLILPQEDMPYLPDGTPVDIMLNPQGVPSRMNLGQILELHMGMAAKKLGVHIATPVFDGAHIDDIQAMMKEAGMDEDGKTVLYDGRTGEPFDNRIAVGVMYMIKLHHMVDDKLHARSTGPYSLVTQQPLGGKAQFGGQRFGEMEVWALYAYGAAHTLQEMMTTKSDDVVGRVKVYESIIKGQEIDHAGVPESFRVLMKEFQALGLDVSIIDDDGKTLELKEIEEAEDKEDTKLNIDEIDKSPAVPISSSDDEDEEFEDTDEEFEEDLEMEEEFEEGADL